MVVPLQRWDEYERLAWRRVETSTAARKVAVREFDAALETASATEEGRPTKVTPEAARELKEAAERAHREHADTGIELRAAEGRANRWLRVAIVAGIVGGLLMSSGFWLWYRRLQRHHDAIVKAEAMKALKPPAEGAS